MPPSSTSNSKYKPDRPFSAVPMVGLSAVVLIVIIELAKINAGHLPSIINRNFHSESSQRESVGELVNVFEEVRLQKDQGNLFISLASRDSQIPHPFFEHVGVLRPGGDDRIDYFGFRNWHGDGIYRATKREYKLVVFLGNSEGAGYHHHTPIGEHIEQKLLHEGQDVRVLNLAASSHSMSHSLSVYLYLAYRLKPEFVIGHFGGMEFECAKVCDKRLVDQGMFYDPIAISAAVQLANRWNDLSYFESHEIYDHDPRVGINGARDVALHFQNMQAGHDGKFIFGLQKLVNTAGREKFYAALRPALMAAKIDIVSFADTKGIVLADNIHSTAASAEVIADVYVKRILAELVNEGTPE